MENRLSYREAVKHRILFNLALDENIRNFELLTDTQDSQNIRLKIENPSKTLEWVFKIHHEVNPKETINSKTITSDSKFNPFNLNHLINSQFLQGSALLIYYTNAKIDLQDQETFQIKLNNQISEIKAIKTSVNCNSKIINPKSCFKFKTNFAPPQCSLFFDNFILCGDQPNLRQCEDEDCIRFCNYFRCERDVYENFRKFHQGTRKITKAATRLKIAEFLLLPHIQTCKITSKTLDKDSKILGQVLKHFDITLLKNKENLERLYQILTENIAHFSRYDLSTTLLEELAITSKLSMNFGDLNQDTIIKFWHINVLPIAVKINESNRISIYKAINLTQIHKKNTRKFIVIHDIIEKRNLPNFTIYENLTDCQNLNFFPQILSDFQISLQKRPPKPIKTIIETNPEILRAINIDSLLGEINDSVEESYEHIPRFFPKIMFDFSLLSDFDNGKNLYIINCHGQAKIIKQIPNIEGVDVYQYLTHDFDLNQTKMVLLSKYRIKRKQFDEITMKTPDKNCHLFQITHESSLEWLYSNRGISHLRPHRITTKNELCEEDIFTYHNYNRIGIISGSPGCGKTWIVNALKKFAPTNYWVITINLARQFPLLVSNGNANDILETIFAINRETVEEHDFRKVYEKSKKIIFIWDDVDRLQNEHLANFEVSTDDNLGKLLKIIKNIQNLGYFQWIVTREHLKQKFEDELNVLGFEMGDLKIFEINNYISKKLKDRKLFQKVESSLIATNGMLGIPIYLKMITDLLNQDPSHQDLLHATPNLFEIIKRYLENKIEALYKKSLVMFDKSSAICLRDTKKYRWYHYENLAMFACFSPEICKKLGVKNNFEFVNDLQADGYPTGIIEKINLDFYPIFEHTIFAEFFAVSWFIRKIRSKTKMMKDFIFLPENKNIRFLFDLAMAKDSALHLDVLYQNFDNLKKYNYDIVVSDSLGRSPLHIALTYGTQFLKLTENNILYSDKAKAIKKDVKYQEIIAFLAPKYEIYQKELLYNWNCIDCAEHAFCLSSMETLSKYTEIKQENFEVYGDIPSVIYYSILFDFKNLFQIFVKKIPNFSQIPNSTFLHLAAELGREDFVKELTKKGVPFWRKYGKNELDEFDCTPMYLAAKNGHLNIVKTLAEFGAKLTPNRSGWNALDIAVANGHGNIVQFLLDKHRTFARINYDQSSPYHWAAKFGHIEMFGHPISTSSLQKPDKNFWNPINCALRYGRENVIKYFLQYYEILRNPEVLCFATEYSSFDVVQYLFENGANFKTAKSWTPLHTAAKCGRLKVAQYLVKIKGSIILNCRDQMGLTPLHCAAKYGNYNIAQFLLEEGAEIDAVDLRSRTPLHLSAAHRHLDLIEILHDFGADINGKHPGGWTPLHEACHKGYTEVVVVLYLLKANIEASRNGFTPLHMAAYSGHCHIIEFLIKFGANPNVLAENVFSPLHSAIRNGQNRAVIKLIEMGSKIHSENPRWSPLFYAGIYNKIEIMNTLVKYGANLMDVIQSGWTLLHYAAENGYLELAQWMVQQGADVNGIDRYGDTPLHYAVRGKHLPIVKFLIAGNAKKLWLNNNGESPLLIAIDLKQNEIRKLLEPPMEHKDSTLRRVATLKR